MNKILLTFFLIPLSFSTPVLEWKGKRSHVIKNYLKIQKKFSKKVCQGGDHIYEELYKEFSGNGFFIPHLNYVELDREAIEKNLVLIENKLKWIKKEREKLERKQHFKVEKEKYKKLKEHFEEVVYIKQQFYESKKNRKSILTEGRKKINLLHERMKELLDRLSFIKPFGHPVDHFFMRKQYDDFKYLTSIEGQKKKNHIFFQRKIFEDGAQNLDHSRSDRFLRALINTLEIQFQNQDAIIDENFRYDFNSFLRYLSFQLKENKEFHLKRLQEWQSRTQRILDSYLNILRGSPLEYTKKILGEMSFIRHQLMEFNFKKQRKVYDFWWEESELNQALFVLETILFNEVGDIDGRNGLERRDVSQVVINRTRIPFYHTIPKKEKIYPYLASIGEQNLLRSKWLNVMFKEGEFSFTYFFIPSSRNIYCPDGSREGQFLRRENLKIILDMLKSPNEEFKAIRYFSRASMLGRINMADIWVGFKALPPRPGKKSMKNFLLKRLYKKGEYHFFYEFRGENGQIYHVLEIKDKSYVYGQSKNDFFDYRNPHFFTYFVRQ